MQRYVIDLVKSTELKRKSGLGLSDVFPIKLLGLEEQQGYVTLDQLFSRWRPSHDELLQILSDEQQIMLKIGILHKLSNYGEDLWRIYFAFQNRFYSIKEELEKEGLKERFIKYFSIAEMYSKNMQALTHDIEFVLQNAFREEIYVFPINQSTFLLCFPEEKDIILRRSMEFLDKYV